MDPCACRAARPSRTRSRARARRAASTRPRDRAGRRLLRRRSPQALPSDERELAAEQARLQASVPPLEAVEVRLDGRVAVDRDVAPLPLQVGGEQRGVAAGAERGVDDGLAGSHGEQPADVVREHWDVITRFSLQDARQHLQHSLRSRRAHDPTLRDPRSRRGRRNPATTTSRRSCACASSGAGIITRPCLSSSASDAPAKRRRWILPRLLAERIQRGESRLDESIPILTTVGLETPLDASRDDDALGEGFAKLGGKGETVLVIDRVLVRSEEHLRPGIALPLFPTLPHANPLVNPSVRGRA